MYGIILIGSSQIRELELFLAFALSLLPNSGVDDLFFISGIRFVSSVFATNCL